jgi:hypothetical protein
VGPITLTARWWSEVSWRVETTSYWSLIAQVLPVLLLAIAVERRAFGEEKRPAHGSLAAFVFVIVVGSAAIAEILALLLLAFPCTGNDCGSSWPSELSDVAAYFTSVAVPAALVLLMTSGAIQSGLPFGGGLKSFQRVATWVFAGAVSLPFGGISVAALATGRLGAGLVAAAATAILGYRARVVEQVEDGEEHIDLELFGRRVLELGEADELDVVDGYEQPRDDLHPRDDPADRDRS